MIETPEPEFAISTAPVPSDSTKVECRGFVYKDEDGRCCAYATRLPGVYGEGDTEAEAFNDLCDAFTFVLESYGETGKAIPWRDSLKRPDLTGTEYWAVVHVKKVAVR
jgi:predicted RNase H-like HicB family nuclease